MATTEISINSEVLDEFNTKESRELHEAINNLLAYGVGRIVNLPQIIVVGDQSSGKSSVLEALCHIRFPVKDGLCTRFATELVLRPATGINVKATIRYFDGNKSPLVIERSGFDEKDLPNIIEESKQHMGISFTDKGFSRDVLRLEIEGPKMYPLTVIDLPGLFYVETETQSLAGKEVVDRLVFDYMSKKESIILNVITANQPLANHEALTRVKAIDLLRERTIGVITKPDLLVQGSQTEAEYVKLVQNNEGANKLLLGWHVVRNRAEMETDLESRDAIEEKFFETGVWESVPTQNHGIFSLRKKLSKVLYDHIRRSLPQLIANIEENLRARESELTRLGPSRSDIDEMRSFLIKVSSTFQALAKDGVDGRYDHPFFGDLENENHKLRAQLRNFNRAFQHILWIRGASRTIRPDNEVFQEEKALPEYLERFLQTYPYDFPDPVATTESDVSIELQRQASINQGKEFPGLSNKDLAIRLFQDQAKPWEGIAQFHIKQVTLVAKAFVDSIFEHILGSPDTNRTTETILATCVDSFFSNKEKVLEQKLDELLRPYRDGYTVALDAEFHAALSKKSMQKIADRVYKILAEKQVLGAISLTKTMITNAIIDDKQLDGGEFGTQTAVDMMLAYYESARRTFAVNVINLAIESCLISDIPEILTPSKVSEMSKEQLKELAEETGDIQARRDLLKADIKALGNALALCQKYKPRSMTTLPLAPVVKSTQEAWKMTPKLGMQRHSLNSPIRQSSGSDKSSIFSPGNSSGSKRAKPSNITEAVTSAETMKEKKESRTNTASAGLFSTPTQPGPKATSPSSSEKNSSGFHKRMPPGQFDLPIYGRAILPKTKDTEPKHISRVPPSKQLEEWKIMSCPYQQRDKRGNEMCAYQHICFIQGHKNESPEEMRLWSYTPPS